MSVMSGLEASMKRGFDSIEGRRVGLLTNPSAVTRTLDSAYDLFCSAPQFELAAIFAPEHGFAAADPDGEHVRSSVDPITGVPVHSLYGKTLRPTPDMMSGLDTLVCDIQDIGVRYYTYAWTITYAIEAAGEAGVEVLIFDRPNPLSSEVDGSPVVRGYESIVGRCPVPVQHGLTIGELARMFNARWNPTPASLIVIACPEYRRAMRWEETGLPFVPPSPAMPHLSTVRQYPGACLLEGTNLSEGRGTALPFEICGAPYIDERRLAKYLNAQGWPGVRFRPHVFMPSAGKYAGKVCRGVQAHPTSLDFRPLFAWVGVICSVRQLYFDQFEWRAPTGSASKIMPFDLLAGGDWLRQQIEGGAALTDLAETWDEASLEWRAQCQEYFLYA